MKKKFIIKGKEHQLESIARDLQEMGYIINLGAPKTLKGFNCITQTAKRPKNKEEVLTLDFFTCGFRSHNSEGEVFNLPHDYSRVLKYAGGLLNECKEFKEGEWVFFESDDGAKKTVGRYTNDNIKIIGLHKFVVLRETYGCDTNGIVGFSTSNLRKATNEEVAEHLLNELKRRGIKEDTKYYPVNICGNVFKGFEYLFSTDDKCRYNPENDTLIVNIGSGFAYCKGTFAEKVPYKIPFKKGEWVVFDPSVGNCVIGKFSHISSSDDEDQIFVKLTQTFNVGDFEYNISDIRRAQDEEIITHLLKEAKKRGLKEGKYYYPVSSKGNIYREIKHKFHYNVNDCSYLHDKDALIICEGTGLLYCKGVFAEVETKITEKYFGSTKVEIDFENNVLKVDNGRMNISFEDFNKLISDISSLNIHSIPVTLEKNTKIKIGCEEESIEVLYDIFHTINEINEKSNHKNLI